MNYHAGRIKSNFWLIFAIYFVTGKNYFADFPNPTKDFFSFFRFTGVEYAVAKPRMYKYKR